MTSLVGRRNLLEGAMIGAAAATVLAASAASAKPEDALVTPTQRLSPADQKVADEILDLTKALESSEVEKNPDQWAAYVAEDYTEINEHFSSILKGRDTGKRYQEFQKATPHIIAASIINNPDIQVWGNVVILCYISLRAIRDKEGRSDPGCRRVTRVYQKRDGRWLLAHSHFGAYDYTSTY